MLTHRPARRLPENITETNFNAFQVRIVRDGQLYSASFPWCTVGKPAALSAAVKWRDMTLAMLPHPGNGKGTIKPTIMKNKKTREPLGVSRYVLTDRRSKPPRKYLRFAVSYQGHDGRCCIKAFQAGALQKLTQEDVFHAAQTAYACREEWEYCYLRGQPFDPEKYNVWKETQLYPFSPKNIKILNK